MGTFSHPIQISSLDGQQSAEIVATEDTGASYSMLPATQLRQLGIRPSETKTFEFADGRQADLDMGEARATINGSTVTTLVIFAEDDVPPLLGAYTLEGLGLAVDPVNQRLIPAKLILY